MPLSDTRIRISICALVVASAAAMAGVGCGTNISEVAAQAGTAVGTTALDLLLTDLANAAADSFDRPQPSSDGVADGDDDDGGDDGDADGGDGGDGDGGDGGASDAGAAAYAANNCAACHGASAEGGIGPALAGMDEFIALQARFANDATHQGTTLTAQEIEDVAAFLLGTDGGSNGAEGDAAGGQALYSDSNCGTCHCADGSGGCALSAPPLVGADVATLDQFLRGGASHAGGTLDVDDQDLADLEAYLATLE